MRPRPASRIAGSNAFVSATGPNTVVSNILSHSVIGVSSAIPAAEMPALCTTAYGAPTASSIDFAAAATEAASVRSSVTPISRGSSAPAPVASRSLSMPASTDRIAATTCHPRSYSKDADANPRPRDAPVMTTLRGSAIRTLGRAGALAGRWRLNAGPAVGQTLLPGGPLTHRERTFGAFPLVMSLWVIHFGLGI